MYKLEIETLHKAYIEIKFNNSVGPADFYKIKKSLNSFVKDRINLINGDAEENDSVYTLLSQGLDKVITGTCLESVKAVSNDIINYVNNDEGLEFY